ncbi:DNA ligase [Candidatus Aerophobetes bacterium]|uniref:DNA ligase n=1 Tax=Aerophobetes bacterium TaxID=2030807 RepID=A0A2A4YMI4_UNCAE|nr:MAG: DNA ligase [Candidatus Aerophobetes bacterium]
MSLTQYKKKRDFTKTKEPKAVKRTSTKKRLFVIQKHYATRLHFDFRLELNGVLKSWAVPKGLSKSTKDKRLAIQTEDHPIGYAKYEGTIPKGQYGAGKVIQWDIGEYFNTKIDDKGKEVSLRKCFKEGYIEIYLKGKRYKGPYALFHFKEKNWLLIKMNETKLKARYEKLGVKYPYAK